MATLAEYRTGVQLLGYDAVSATLVDAAIQQARRLIFQDHRWSFLEAGNTSLNTSANVSTVSLTAITDLAHLESVRLLTEREPLDWLPYQDLRDLRKADPDATGVPRVWARRKGTLIFYPTPDAAYALDVDYLKDPGDLAGGEDIVPDRFQDMVTWKAVPPLAFRQREHQTAAAAENMYGTLLRRYASQDATEQRQTSRQVRCEYWS